MCRNVLQRFVFLAVFVVFSLRWNHNNSKMGEQLFSAIRRWSIKIKELARFVSPVFFPGLNKSLFNHVAPPKQLLFTSQNPCACLCMQPLSSTFLLTLVCWILPWECTHTFHCPEWHDVVRFGAFAIRIVNRAERWRCEGLGAAILCKDMMWLNRPQCRGFDTIWLRQSL